jgi:hypothetical protein
MSKKKVSAKEAAAEIRAGMDDAALMKRFNLSSEGLQSLIDKLVHAGFIDLGEVGNRLQGVLGAVSITERTIVSAADGGKNGSQPHGEKSPPLVNAQEAARDIRLGMNDQALMGKYRLTFNGLQSLFNKLISAGLITEADLVRRISFDADHTVDLREEKLSFSDALLQLGLDKHESSNADAKMLLTKSVAVQPVKEFSAAETLATDKNRRESLGYNARDSRQNARQGESAWYNNHAVLGFLLIALFPLGFYGLYRNVALSSRVKAVILLAWVGIAVVSLLLFQAV